MDKIVDIVMTMICILLIEEVVFVLTLIVSFLIFMQVL